MDKEIMYERDFCVWPSFGYWSIHGKAVSAEEAEFGLHPLAIYHRIDHTNCCFKGYKKFNVFQHKFTKYMREYFSSKLATIAMLLWLLASAVFLASCAPITKEQALMGAAGLMIYKAYKQDSVNYSAPLIINDFML